MSREAEAMAKVAEYTAVANGLMSLQAAELRTFLAHLELAQWEDAEVARFRASAHLETALDTYTLIHRLVHGINHSG